MHPLETQIQEMLAGKLTPPTPVADYLTKTLKGALAECDAITPKIQEGERVLAQLRSQLAASHGVAQKAHQDLRAILAATEGPALKAVNAE